MLVPVFVQMLHWVGSNPGCSPVRRLLPPPRPPSSQGAQPLGLEQSSMTNLSLTSGLVASPRELNTLQQSSTGQMVKSLIQYTAPS